VQKGWLKHVLIYLNKPIDSLVARLTCFLQAHYSIRKEWDTKHSMLGSITIELRKVKLGIKRMSAHTYFVTRLTAITQVTLVKGVPIYIYVFVFINTLGVYAQ
jgi:hypothetical protein